MQPVSASSAADTGLVVWSPDRPASRGGGSGPLYRAASQGGGSATIPSNQPGRWYGHQTKMPASAEMSVSQSTRTTSSQAVGLSVLPTWVLLGGSAIPRPLPGRVVVVLGAVAGVAVLRVASEAVPAVLAVLLGVGGGGHVPRGVNLAN